jgi:glycosyltransferase involved in cell wall biosynthesis
MTSVSVVIPCYDLGEFLTEAVDSVLAQTRPADELIVVDDGSTDPLTLDVLNDLRGRGVRAYRTENRGAPSARNYGIERSRGEFVLCLDADDVLMPRFLEATVPALEHAPEAGIAATQVEFFGKADGTWRPPPVCVTTMLWRNCLPSASLFRRRCWEEAGGYTPDLEACQDWSLWLSFIERGWKWVVVDEALYRYRRRDGSISDTRESERPRIVTGMMRRHERLFAEHGVEALVELDGENKRTRERLTAFRRDNAKLHARIAELEERLRPPEHEQVEPFRVLVDAHVPEGAHVLVATKGDADLLKLGQREARHFPRKPDGGWLGYHPKTQESRIEMLQEARVDGAEYLCFPRDERWWLKRYDDFRRYLETTYSVVARSDEGVIFDVRREIPRRSFSVVICTYRRAELIERSMRSVFEQRYPADRFELIVVNNASPDDTEAIVQRTAADSPVPFTYLVEERNGLSYARNAGIAAASNEFVAFLDDDAVACGDWLAHFNGVIDEQRALVVGGRVEKAFDDGFEPPDWFESQYAKHMFGINYRDRGRKEKVFRIRYPLYLGGGNIAYARRLFEHFGGFDPRLGRDGKSLRGGEESYLNLILDRHDIPMYYTDDAWIDHYLETSRLTKKHLRRKAYWAGVTNAVIHPLFFGFPEMRGRVKNNRKEVGAKLAEIRSDRGSPENFSRQLRVIYNLSFLARFHRRSLANRLGMHRRGPDDVSWGVEQWLEEVRSWPDGAAKHDRLLALARDAGDDALAAEAGRALGTGAAPDRRRQAPVGVDPARHMTRAEYERLVARVRQRVSAQVPPGAGVAVVSKGDDALVQLDGRPGTHFPRLADGTYAGHHPADSATAIAGVEALVRDGVTHLVFPASAAWWQSHYRELTQYLDRRHERVWDEADTCVIYRLRPADPQRPARNGHRSGGALSIAAKQPGRG